MPQNPHAVREPKENNLEQAIGHEVRTYRRKLGLTVADLANATGISVWMLSKIENGNISSSLLHRAERADQRLLPLGHQKAA